MALIGLDVAVKRDDIGHWASFSSMSGLSVVLQHICVPIVSLKLVSLALRRDGADTKSRVAFRDF